MGVNLSKIDLSNVEARKPFEVMPTGWYPAEIESIEEQDNSQSEGSHLFLTACITEGLYKGRKLFDRINVNNPNQTTVDIAFQTLKSIYNACGKVRVKSSDELLGIPLKLHVKLKKAETGKDGKQYDARNEISGYDHISSDHEYASGEGGSGLARGTAQGSEGAPAWADGEEQAETPPARKTAAARKPAAPPAAAVEEGPLVLTEEATEGGELTLQDYYDQGWDDDGLLENGLAVREEAKPKAAPKAPPAKKTAAAPNKAAAATKNGGKTPSWAQ